MLLIDGVKYLGYAPKDEKELEDMVQEHTREIFGPDCIYFSKHKLRGNYVATIPDGYAITFNPDQWWIVEVELSNHSVYDHIQPQVSKFITAWSDPTTQTELVKVLYNEIIANEGLKVNLQKARGGELYKWLSDLINIQPKLAVIIDKSISGLDAAWLHSTIKPKIIEFATYTREGVGLAVHGHRFEPLLRPTSTTPTPQRIKKEREVPEKENRPMGKSKPPRKGRTPVTITIDGKVPSSWADACRMVDIWVGVNSAKRAWDAGYPKLRPEDKARVKGM